MRTIVLALAVLLAQSAPSKPSFEVVTIKRNVGGEGGSIGMQAGGRFRAVNANVLFLISTMYRTPGGARLFLSQILGLPAWATTEKYDITGKVGEQLAGRPVQEQFRNMAPMVQSMLEDRFKLRLHHETQPMPTYVLVVTKPDVMRRSTTDCSATPDKCRIESIPGHFSAVSLRMNDLVIFLSNTTERVVTDRTGLQGTYDVDIDWAADAGSDKPSIFTAVQEKLGLKLEFERAPVDVVVIDHIEHPTED